MLNNTIEFLTVPHSIMRDLKLNPTEKIILIELYNSYKDKKPFEFSYNDFKIIYNFSFNQMNKILDKLQYLGYIQYDVYLKETFLIRNLVY